jgi:hypothetical protein
LKTVPLMVNAWQKVTTPRIDRVDTTACFSINPVTEDLLFNRKSYIRVQKSMSDIVVNSSTGLPS